MQRRGFDAFAWLLRYLRLVATLALLVGLALGEGLTPDPLGSPPPLMLLPSSLTGLYGPGV